MVVAVVVVAVVAIAAATEFVKTMTMKLSFYDH